MVQSRNAICNNFKKFAAIVAKSRAKPASPEKLGDKLLRRHVTHSNVPATCLTTQLQGKLYRVTLA